MSFDLTGLTQVQEAWLSIFTTSPTSGTVYAARMLQDWGVNATWNDFGDDGISINGTGPDGIEAEQIVSWSWDAPAASEVVRVDVTADVKAWVEEGVPNYGWVIYQDSNDGWDFTSFEASIQRPMLEVKSTLPAPTASPTPFDPTRPTGVPTFGRGANTITLQNAVDTTLRSDSPDTEAGESSLILVELEADFEAQALISFELPEFAADSSIRKSILEVLTISPTVGTITGWRMLQPWDDSAVWSQFGGDGVQPDGVEAASTPSFTLVFPRGSEVAVLDVSADVALWLSGEPNYGWVLTSDSSDGWTFNAADSDYLLPTLFLTTDMDIPTAMPTESSGIDYVQVLPSVDLHISQGLPDDNFEDTTFVWIDQTGYEGQENQALIKFGLAGVVQPISAQLELLTTGSTTCGIAAHVMLQPWDKTATWNTFGPDGILRDDVMAASTPTFNFTGTNAGEIMRGEVFAEVDQWFNGLLDNNGWALFSDCGNSYVFNSQQGPLRPPTLVIGQPLPPIYKTNWNIGVDTEVRSNYPNTPLGLADRISVDLSDGVNPDGTRANTNGLVKFDLTGLQSVRKVILQIFTVSPTSGTISAHRMIQPWDQTATWNKYGGDGIQNDDVEAQRVPSFQWVAPRFAEYLQADVTNDVKFWLENPDQNQGYVFLTDSNDGWDFTTIESGIFRPVLFLGNQLDFFFFLTYVVCRAFSKLCDHSMARRIILIF